MADLKFAHMSRLNQAIKAMDNHMDTTGESTYKASHETFESKEGDAEFQKQFSNHLREQATSNENQTNKYSDETLLAAVDSFIFKRGGSRRRRRRNRKRRSQTYNRRRRFF
jgi:hypothetical protein